MRAHLKQCPFCGFSAHQDHIRDWLFLGRKSFYVECNWCFATTDFFKTLDLAIEAWNKRTKGLLDA